MFLCDGVEAMWTIFFQVFYFSDNQCTVSFPANTPEIHGSIFVGGNTSTTSSNETAMLVMPALCGSGSLEYIWYGGVPPTPLSSLDTHSHLFAASDPISLRNGSCYQVANGPELYNPQHSVPLGSIMAVSCGADHHCELAAPSPLPPTTLAPTAVSSTPVTLSPITSARTTISPTTNAPTTRRTTGKTSRTRNTTRVPTDEESEQHSHDGCCHNGHCDCYDNTSDAGWAILILFIIIFGFCTIGLYFMDAILNE